MAKMEQDVVVLLQEQIDALDNRVQLLEIIAKKGGSQDLGQSEVQFKKVIQVNIGTSKYFCETQEEVLALSAKNPGLPTETFNVELPVAIANEYLNDAENKAAIEAKG